MLAWLKKLYISQAAKREMANKGESELPPQSPTLPVATESGASDIAAAAIQTGENYPVGDPPASPPDITSYVERLSKAL